MSKRKPEPTELKGWHHISEFLGQPVSVAQRWAKQSGMPVVRKGRFVVAAREELNRWLGRESGGEPLHVVTEETDLAADLRKGLAYVRQHAKPKVEGASQSAKRPKHRQ